MTKWQQRCFIKPTMAETSGIIPESYTNMVPEKNGFGQLKVVQNATQGIRRRQTC
jgi:hypothetical protein